jgi:hypothetical protein
MDQSDQQSGQGNQPWAKHVASIEVGDRVCYSKRFLQSTGQYTGDAPQGRGTVTALVPLGETTVAEIDWNIPDLPKRVNVANLSRVTEKGILDRD